VDALLGTGAKGPARGSIATAIEAINAARDHGGARVFAVDLPSGLDCDTGQPLGECVRADVTGTFVARKIGFDRPGADTYTGDVHVLDIGVPRALLLEIG
jgi:NAD(P)H-hydrate epimerase